VENQAEARAWPRAVASTREELSAGREAGALQALAPAERSGIIEA